MESTDPHLVDNEQGREWRMAIIDVKGNSLAVELPKIRVIRVVDENELADLHTVNTWCKAKKSQTHIRKETYEENVFVEEGVVVATHKQAVARFMLGMTFDLRREPTTPPEVGPLSPVNVEESHMPCQLTTSSSESTMM